MFRMMEYRITVNRSQHRELDFILYSCMDLFNAALEAKKWARKKGANVSRFDQIKEIAELRKLCPEYSAIYSQILGDVITRLDRGYQAFFRRVKSGKKPGYPRFKNKKSYKSFTFPQVSNRYKGRKLRGGGVDLQEDGRLKVYGITGLVKVIWHRPLLGTPKSVTFKKRDDKWYISIVCDDISPDKREATGQIAGIDVGIANFATLHDGSLIENPRFFEKSQAKIGLLQRQVSKKRKGSRRRQIARKNLSRAYLKISRKRMDFHRKTACLLVRNFDVIGVEDLNFSALSSGMLSKQVSDAGWSGFVRRLESKAESAGSVVVRVDPNLTSQECSSCGRVVRKKLSQRTHDCICGLVIDRDHNAAINIKNKVLSWNRSGSDPRGATARKIVHKGNNRASR